MLTRILAAFTFMLMQAPLLGRPITLGFEAEFSDADYPPTDLFPFMDPLVDSENAGNKEIKSFGGESSIDEVVNQMKQIKDYYGENLRSIHVRVRFEKKSRPLLEESMLRGYCSRLSEIVTGWRLRWRRPWFALESLTQLRQSPSQVLIRRGSVRLIDLGDKWDIEVRGYMNSVDNIKLSLETLKNALDDPRLMDGYLYLQTALNLRKDTLAGFVARYLGPLTNARKSDLATLESTIHYRSFIPLFGLEDDPTLIPEMRERITAANKDLAKNLLTFIDSGTLRSSPGKAVLYSMLAHWQKSANYHIGMIKALRRPLSDSVLSQINGLLQSRIDIAGGLGPRAYADAEAAFETVTGNFMVFSSWAAQRVRETLASERDLDNLYLLGEGQGLHWRVLINDALTHRNPVIRKSAWNIVREHPPSDFPALTLERLFSQETDLDVVNMALANFFDSTKEKPFGLAKALLPIRTIKLKLRQKMLAAAYEEASSAKQKQKILLMGFADPNLSDYAQRLMTRETLRPSPVSHCGASFKP